MMTLGGRSEPTFRSALQRSKFGNRARIREKVAMVFIWNVRIMVSTSIPARVSQAATLFGCWSSRAGTRPRIPALWIMRLMVSFEMVFAKDRTAVSLVRSRVYGCTFGRLGFGAIVVRSMAKILVEGRWVAYASTKAAPRPLAAPVMRIVGIVLLVSSSTQLK
jgi:hypothetical protein